MILAIIGSVSSSVVLFRILTRLKKEIEIIKSRITEEIYRNVIEVEQSEKLKLSTDLHDVIGNDLIGLYYQLQGTKYQSQIKSVFSKVRNLSHDLNYSFDFELLTVEEILKELIENYFENRNITLHVDSELLKTEVKDYKLNQLYRILQELFVNIVKHSDSNDILIKGYFYDDNIIIEIVNDGVKRSSGYNSGIGIKNIKKRVSIWSGSYQFVINEEIAQSILKFPIKNF
jgi:two-component system NarL family sensor kinase